MCADAAELMHQGITAQCRPVLDRDVSSQGGAIGENGVIADETVMRDVGLRHDPVVVADTRQGFGLERAALNRDVFADRIAVADFDTGVVFGSGRLVLRNLAERCELKDPIALPDHHRSAQYYVRPDPIVVTDLDAGTDDAVRTDRDVVADPCRGIDDGRRVNHAWASSALTPPLRKAQSMSASQASSPSTVARQENFQMSRL